MNTPEFKEHKQYAFEVFCKTVLRNKARNLHKKQQKQERNEIPFADMMCVAESIAHEDTYCLADPIRMEYAGHSVFIDDETLAAALAMLVPKYREIIILSYFLDRNDTEIAKELGLPVSTVNNRKNSAIRRLRDRMRNENE